MINHWFNDTEVSEIRQKAKEILLYNSAIKSFMSENNPEHPFPNNASAEKAWKVFWTLTNKRDNAQKELFNMCQKDAYLVDLVVSLLAGDIQPKVRPDVGVDSGL